MLHLILFYTLPPRGMGFQAPRLPTALGARLLCRRGSSVVSAASRDLDRAPLEGI